MTMTSICHKCKHCRERAQYREVFHGVIPIPFLGWLGDSSTEFSGYTYWCSVRSMVHPVTGRKSMAKCGEDVNTGGDCKFFKKGQVRKLKE